MKKHPPTPASVQKFFAAHKLTAAIVARRFKITERTVNYWLSGKTELPYSYFVLLRLYVDGQIPEDI